MKLRYSSFLFSRNVLVAASICLTSSIAHAADWVGGIGNWDGATNWSGGAWTAGDAAAFKTGSGNVTLQSPVSVGGLTFDVGGYTIQNNGTATNTLTLNPGNIQVTNAADTATINAKISGTSGLSKTGAGSLVLGASNAFTGGVNVSGGRLYVNDANGLNNNSITLSNGAVLEGKNQGSGTVSAFGTGDITVSAGESATIRLNDMNIVTTNSSASSKFIVNGNATFEVTDGDTGHKSNGAYFGFYNKLEKLTGSGNITLKSVNGGARLYWSIDASGYTGSSISIADGSSVATFNSASFGNAKLTVGKNATFDTNTAATVNYLASSETTAFVKLSNTLTLNPTKGDISDGAIYSGLIQGTSGITKTGTGSQTLSGTCTYSGATNVSAGTLYINGSLGSSTTTTVAAAGTLGGTGTLNGTTTVNGTLSPGAAANTTGTLNLASALTLNGVCDFNLDSSNLSTDRIFSTASILFGGTLNVTDIAGAPAFAPGQSYDLFDFASATGTFSAVNLPTLPAGMFWDQSQLYSLGVISVIPEPSVALLGGLGGLLLLRRRRQS